MSKPSFFGGNSLKSEDRDHRVYEGTGTSIATAGMKEVTIVEKSGGDSVRGSGSTMQKAREDAWQKHDLAQRSHQK